MTAVISTFTATQTEVLTPGDLAALDADLTEEALARQQADDALAADIAAEAVARDAAIGLLAAQAAAALGQEVVARQQADTQQQAEINAALQQQTQTLATVTSTQTSQGSALTQLTTRVGTVETDMDNLEEAFANDIDAIDAKITAAAGSYSSLAARLTGLDNRIDNISTSTGGSGGSSFFATIRVTDPTETAVRAGITAWLNTRDSNGFLRAKLFLDFTGKVRMTTPFIPVGTGQLREPHIEGRGMEATIIEYDRADVALFSAGDAFPTWRNWTVKNLTVVTTTSHTATSKPTAFYLWSGTSGTLSNQHGKFLSLALDGAWKDAFALGGPANSDLNSEVFWDDIYGRNTASFSNGFWTFGALPGNIGQNQGLNYGISNSKIEISHGTILNVQYGGQITLGGGYNSWLFTGQSQPGGGAGVGTMIKLGAGSVWQSGPILRIHTLRPEIRGNSTVVLDSSWAETSLVYFGPGYDDTSWAYQESPGVWKINDNPLYKLRGVGKVLFDTVRLAGHIETYGAADIRLRGVEAVGQAAANPPSASFGTGATSAAFVRKISGNSPIVRYSAW